MKICRNTIFYCFNMHALSSKTTYFCNRQLNTPTMIQRIQSLYLLLTSVMAIIFLPGRFLRFFNNSGSEIVLNITGLWQLSAGKPNELVRTAWMVPALFVLIAVLALTTIFLFRKRKLQLKLSLALIVLSVAAITALIISVLKISSEFSVTLAPVAGTILPVLVLLFSILSYRSIRRDEDLVRSYDRLR